jgi:hypothetical protein
MRRKIQKNAFGRWMKILLSDICLETVVPYGGAGLGDVADAVDVVETLKDDYYCYCNAVDLDSVADFDSDDLREVSSTFGEFVDDLRNFSADADAFVHVADDGAVVHDVVGACCHHCYSRYCYWHERPRLDWAFGADTTLNDYHLAASSCVDVPPHRNRYCLAE